MVTVLILVALFALGWVIMRIRRAANRGIAKALYKNTNAKAMEEVHSVLSYSSPAQPESVQAAVEAGLGIEREIPGFAGKLHIRESRPGHVQVALGSKLGTEWVGLVTFTEGSDGGTSGRYEVTNWTLHDGVISSGKIVEQMRSIRERITAALVSTGGSVQVDVVPAPSRK